MVEDKRKGHVLRNLVIGFAVLLVIALLIIWLAPVMTAAYTVSAPYQDTETYYVSEPYQALVEEPLAYTVSSSYKGGGWSIDLGCYAEAFVTVVNADTSPGTFVVDFTFPTLNQTYHDSDRAYIFPGESKTLTGTADIPCGQDWNWNYNMTPGTKTVTETQYQQVEHQRIVTKERAETRYKKVAVLDYLLNY